MNIEINKTEERVNVVMNGELDTLAAEMAEPQVKEIEAAATLPITIDCTALDYISSSGLRLLLRIRKAANQYGNKVTLIGVNANIMEVLNITHFNKMFEIL